MTKKQAEKLVDEIEGVLRDWKLYRYAYDSLTSDDADSLRSQMVHALLTRARRFRK